MSDLSSYLNLYLETASAYVEKLLKDLSMYDQDPTNTNVINDMHISVHALKGQSLVMGYHSTGNLCLQMEYIFREAKEGRLTMSSELKQEIKTSLEKVKNSLESIKTTNKELDLSDEKMKLESLSGVKTN